jgi:hypothetical protein
VGAYSMTCEHGVTTARPRPPCPRCRPRPDDLDGAPHAKTSRTRRGQLRSPPCGGSSSTSIPTGPLWVKWNVIIRRYRKAIPASPVDQGCDSVPEGVAVLTRQDIENVAARFREERPQYERAVNEVHTRTVRLLDGRALKSVVTSRAKSVDSLKRSLWRDREKWFPEQFEHSLAPPLVDLAGVRVLLYQDSDVEPARDALLEMFPTLRNKDKRSADAYSAYHLVVHEWCPDDDPASALRGISCESRSARSSNTCGTS